LGLPKSGIAAQIVNCNSYPLLIFHICALFLNRTNRQTMYEILLSLHNLLRWIVLFLLVLNLIRHFAAINRPFNGLDKQLGLWLMIAAHITLLIGLYQWFAGSLGLPNILHNGMATVMQNPTYRFFAVEHAVGMLIAIT